MIKLKDILGENMRRFGTKNLQEADASVAAPQIAKNNSCWDARKYPIIAGYINNKSIDLTGLIKVVILAVTSNSPLQSILVKQYTFLNSSDQQTLNGVLSEVKLFAKCITTNYAQMLAI